MRPLGLPNDGVSAPKDADTPEQRDSNVARLFREHNRMLVGLLVGRLKNEQEAKEVAQEAYVKLLQLDTAKGAVSYLRAYLFRIAENLAIDLLRQRHTRSRVDRLNSLDDLCEEPRAERVVIAQQELQLLRDAVDELPDRCREAFRLHKIEDRPLEEVALRMGISERMVRKFITRALIYIGLRRDGHSLAQAKELLRS